MKRIITAALLTSAMLAAPFAQAASYQDRSMATGTVVGATTGAVVGSGNNQLVEGAVFGAVLGTIAGALLASQHQPAYVVQQPRTHHRSVVVHHTKHRSQKASYSHSSNRKQSRYADSHRHYRTTTVVRNSDHRPHKTSYAHSNNRIQGRYVDSRSYDHVHNVRH